MINNNAKFYIKLEDGQPAGHPLIASNLIEALAYEHNLAIENITEAFILSQGYAKFESTELKPGQYIEKVDDPTYRLDPDGIVRPEYQVLEFTQEEKVNNWVRKPRDFELARSDWTQLPDAPLSQSKKAEWAAYRQQLRDMTVQYANIQDPSEIIPPTKPN